MCMPSPKLPPPAPPLPPPVPPPPPPPAAATAATVKSAAPSAQYGSARQRSKNPLRTDQDGDDSVSSGLNIPV